MEKFKKNIFTEDINIKSNINTNIENSSSPDTNKRNSTKIVDNTKLTNTNLEKENKNNSSNNEIVLNKKMKQLCNYIAERKLNITEIQRLTWSGLPFGNKINNYLIITLSYFLILN